jgi:hypothetical protein
MFMRRRIDVVCIGIHLAAIQSLLQEEITQHGGNKAQSCHNDHGQRVRILSQQRNVKTRVPLRIKCQKTMKCGLVGSKNICGVETVPAFVNTHARARTYQCPAAPGLMGNAQETKRNK